MEATNTPAGEAAIAYASLGWCVIPVMGKVPQGGAGWPKLATRDPGEAAVLFEDWPHDGVGVVLGQRSGVIDLECDSPEAEQQLQELFGGEIPHTPTFRSTRGLHRLFRWTDALPPSELEKAKFNLGAIEFRAGGGDKAAQTVFPPSGGRTWLVSPDDEQPAEIPATVLVKIATRVAESKKRAPAPTNYVPHEHHGDESLDVGRWLARRGVEVLATDATGDVRRWFIRCPRLEAHTTADGVKDCCVTQDQHGKLGGHCFHASCGMSDWQALSEAIGRPTYEDYHGERPPILEGAVEAILAAGIAAKSEQSEGEDEEIEEETSGEFETGVTFPSECLSPSGLLGEIMAFNLRTALYPQPELALAGAIALVGVVTGRKVTDSWGTRTNVYTLGLGLSGAGKEHARKINKDLLLRSGGEKQIGSERVGSHAGIVTTIHDTPASLMQLDEMGRLLETMKDPRKSPHLYNCITVLMQLYSSSSSVWKSDAYADAKKVKTVDQPHLCIYGTATPDSFWHSLSTDNIAEGLIGRLLVFEGRGYEVDLQEPGEFEAPADLLEALRWWNDFRPGGNLSAEHPAPKKVPHTPEAMERLNGHIRSINERRKGEHHLRAAVWSRSGEKVAKLALIHACSRARCLPETITFADVDWAVRLGNYLTRRLLVGCGEHVSENDVEARAKRVLRLIPDEGISSRNLSRRTQWLRSRERDEILRDLVGAGLVVQELRDGNRRPTTFFKRCRRRQNCHKRPSN
jgi:hypothetical protein